MDQGPQFKDPWARCNTLDKSASTYHPSFDSRQSRTHLWIKLTDRVYNSPEEVLSDPVCSNVMENFDDDEGEGKGNDNIVRPHEEHNLE